MSWFWVHHDALANFFCSSTIDLRSFGLDFSDLRSIANNPFTTQLLLPTPLRQNPIESYQNRCMTAPSLARIPSRKVRNMS
jgi:hypothetical protein